MTYYNILEIPENASDELIHKAHKALADKYRPDIYKGDRSAAEEQLRRIDAAYETLSDPERRLAYDKFLHSVKGIEAKEAALGAGYPSIKKSIKIISILIAISYIFILRGIRANASHNMAAIHALWNLFLTSASYMLVPLTICFFRSPLKAIHIKGICRVYSVVMCLGCASLSVLGLSVKDVLSALCVIIAYHFISKHVLLQMFRPR